MVRRLEYKNHLQKNKRYSTIVHRSGSGEIFIFISIIQSRGKRMSVIFTIWICFSCWKVIRGICYF